MFMGLMYHFINEMLRQWKRIVLYVVQAIEILRFPSVKIWFLLLSSFRDYRRNVKPYQHIRPIFYFSSTAFRIWRKSRDFSPCTYQDKNKNNQELLVVNLKVSNN